MQFRLLPCALALASLAAAQPDRSDAGPQMVWQGEVEGSAFLFVHGKKLKVESPKGAAVARQQYRINDPLPDFRQNVRLQVSQARGWVHIADQPTADNDYTLALAIEDRQSGPALYSIALYWNAGDSFDRTSDRGRQRLKWSGRVDQDVVVSCVANQCSSVPTSGVPAMHEKAKFSAPLPHEPVRVSLQDVQGRGEVRIVQQPAESNGYVTRVQISDRDEGPSDYAFVLTWKRRTPGAKGAGMDDAGQPMAPQRGLLWTGNVTGTVRVTVRGGVAFSQAIAGPPVATESAIFDRPLPARSDLRPALTKRQGQGDVEVVEYPTDGNGYQLVFEVRATKVKPDYFEIEVAW